MTQQCCGMENQNCCPQGPQGKENCYTVWDRKCTPEDNPQCQVVVERKCHPVTLPDCRNVQEIRYKTFTVSECQPRPVRKCFEYTKKVCQSGTAKERREVTWKNEALKKLSDNKKKECYNVDTFNCTDINTPETITQRVPRVRVVNDTRPSCRFVQEQEPAREISVPVTRIVYRQACYNMNVPVCTTNQCSTVGYCEQGTNLCSNNQFNTATVCPNAVGGQSQVNPGGGAAIMGGQSACQQVRQPVCYGSGPNSPCNAQSQQCCRTNTQRVCRNIPQRVTQQVKQMIPGQVRVRQVCENVVYPRQETYYETVQKLVNNTRKDCQKYTKQECHDFNQPTYTVVTEQKTEAVEIDLPKCKVGEMKATHCHTFPDGEIQCRDSTVRKGIKINKIKCDRRVTLQQCFDIPRANCMIGTNQKCRMVPREVCQPSCSQSSFCNQCDEFRRGPGFGSCPTSTCGSFYPGNDYYLRNDTLYNWGGSSAGGSYFNPGSSGGAFPYATALVEAADGLEDKVVEL